ncbi:MAG: hypothetical protein ACRDGJ_07100 [Candidatus Limnocylindria bacterium]
MEAQLHEPAILLRADDAGLPALQVVAAPELGGWVVVNATTLKIVEPGYLWRHRDHAIAWARRELAAQRREAMEYRRTLQLVAQRGLAP